MKRPIDYQGSDEDDEEDNPPVPATFAMIPQMMNDLGQLALELGNLEDSRSRLQNRMGNIRARLWEHGPAFIVANIEHFAPMYEGKLREAFHPIVDFKGDGNMYNNQKILACGGHALVRAGESEFAIVWFETPETSLSNAELSYYRGGRDGDAESHIYHNRDGWTHSREISNDSIAQIIEVLKDDRHRVIEFMCKLHDTLEKFHMDPLKVWNQAEDRRAAKRAKE
jgi:hypothetical protein